MKPLIRNLLIIFHLFGFTNLSFASDSNVDFERQATFFVNALTRLSALCKNDPSCLAIRTLHPWDRPYIFVNREKPNEFIGINLSCPHDIKCESKSTGGGKIRMVRGSAPTSFDVPANNNYSFLTSNTVPAESTLAKLMSASNVQMSVLSFMPWTIKGQENSPLVRWFQKDWFVVYSLIHEAFHMMVQYSSVPTQPAWLNDSSLFLKASRRSSQLCRPSGTSFMHDEDVSLDQIGKDILASSNLQKTLFDVYAWNARRESRYQQNPTVTGADGKISDCRVLDIMYERLEGMAEYAGFSSALRLGLVQESELQGYYREVYFSAANDRNVEFGFYITGFYASQILEKLDPSGAWQAEIFSSPTKTYLDILEEHSKYSCYDPNIKSISVPINAVSSKAGQFPLKYRLVKGNGRSQTKILFLSGGPGQPTVSHPPNFAEDFDKVFVDLRGFGCNKLPRQKALLDSISTESAANDVAALMKKLNLKDSIIYGVSYGTVLATQLSSVLNKHPALKPKFVVLEGTLSSALSESQLIGRLQEEWKRVLSSLPTEQQAKLEAENLPYNLTGSQWGQIINRTLAPGSKLTEIEGKQAYGNSLAQLLNSTLSESPTSESEKTSKDLLLKIAEPSRYDSDEELAYRQIWCSELASVDNRDFELVRGNLILGQKSKHFCRNTPLVKPYNSSKYPIDGNLIYFHGTADTIIPVEQAYRHYADQPSQHKAIFAINKAGHNPLSLTMKSCVDVIFHELAQSRFPDLKALNCPVIYQERQP